MNAKPLHHRARTAWARTSSGRPLRLFSTACATLAAAVALGLAVHHRPATAARAQAGSEARDAESGGALSAANATVLDARDALKKRDRQKLAAARAALVADGHPLAMWVDYWELGSRLYAAQQEELEAFYARWAGTYVEDRLRNDWLLELGRRRDWKNFAVDYPRFRMNDDREVSCYALLVRQLNAEDVSTEARAAWFAQKDADDGCNQLAQSQFDAGRFKPADAWHKARWSMDWSRPKAARLAVDRLPPEVGQAVDALIDSPTKYLAKRASASGRTAAELTTLALLRLIASDGDGARRMLEERWDRVLPADLAAWVWASLGRQAALQLSPDAPDLFQRAEQRLASGKDGVERDVAWTDETQAWKVRAALRASAGVGDGITKGAGRWLQVLQAIDAMSETEQREPTWQYWKGRALQALAPAGADGDDRRAQARELLAGIAGQMSFYGKLAAEDLGRPVPIPPRPAALSAPEREAAAQNAGLSRALLLIQIGLRSEGVREWNYTLRGMDDRQLLAAAQRACDVQVWDRCINTSDRTRAEIDLDQRFPTPFRREVLARAQDIGLDPAYIYGLIRQESRFIMDARSSVGASGLMQIMPATARWTAKKTGIPFTHDMLTDRDVNLKLGTSYLKLVLDDFDGSQAMAAAAYNAGPGRPRKWRDGPLLEVAAWAENIPFNETRDYVKKVLSNATYYAAVLGQPVPSLKARLGRGVGPRDTSVPEPTPDLP